MTSMIKNPELFNSFEEAFATAGWFGTVHVMREIATQHHELQSRQMTIGRHVLNLCYTLLRCPEDLMDDLKQCTPDQGMTYNTELKPQFQTLQNLGIYNRNGSINTEFATALDIFIDQDWQNELIKQTSFGDTLSTALEVSDYYKQHIGERINKGFSIDGWLPLVIRDLDFYVGFYDQKIK